MWFMLTILYILTIIHLPFFDISARAEPDPMLYRTKELEHRRHETHRAQPEQPESCPFLFRAYPKLAEAPGNPK